jgi:hypothetical protein
MRAEPTAQQEDTPQPPSPPPRNPEDGDGMEDDRPSPEDEQLNEESVFFTSFEAQ